jgi:hypothetical protein
MENQVAYGYKEPKAVFQKEKKSLIWLSDMQPGNEYVKKQLQKSLRRRKNSKNVIAAAS